MRRVVLIERRSHLAQYNLIELGKFITKRRKELSLRQSDLADPLISVSYISGIENGKVLPSKSKLKHLCKKLRISLEDLDKLMREEDESSFMALNCMIEFQLMMITNNMQARSSEETLQAIEDLPTLTDPLHQATVAYLKGKCLAEQREWRQAVRHFERVITLSEQHSFILSTNLVSCSYCEWSIVAFLQNDLHTAVDCVQKGLQCYHENGDRKYVIYHLKVSLVIYLQRLNRNNEAMQILDELWPQMNQIKSHEVLLNMYEVRASILSVREMYYEAIFYAIEGLELARLNHAYDRQFELWTTLGTCYQKLDRLYEAKSCYESANRLRSKIKKEYLLITIHTQLGNLYVREGKFDLAEQIFFEAIEIGSRTQDQFRLCECLMALANCYAKQGNKTSAVAKYEEALQIADRLCLDEHIRSILLSILPLIDKKDQKHKKIVDRFIQLSVTLSQGGEHEMRKYIVRSFNLDGDPPGT